MMYKYVKTNYGVIQFIPKYYTIILITKGKTNQLELELQYIMYKGVVGGRKLCSGLRLLVYLLQMTLLLEAHNFCNFIQKGVNN